MIRKLGSGARRKVEKVQWRSSDKRPVAWAGAGSSVVEIQMTQLLKFIERLSEGHKNICIDMRSRLGINWQPNFHPFWIFWPELFWLLLWLFTASVTLYWAGAVQSLNSLNISFAEILMPDKEVELLSPFFLFLCFKSRICNVKIVVSLFQKLSQYVNWPPPYANGVLQEYFMVKRRKFAPEQWH